MTNIRTVAWGGIWVVALAALIGIAAPIPPWQVDPDMLFNASARVAISLVTVLIFATLAGRGAPLWLIVAGIALALVQGVASSAFWYAYTRAGSPPNFGSWWRWGSNTVYYMPWVLSLLVVSAILLTLRLPTQAMKLIRNLTILAIGLCVVLHAIEMVSRTSGLTLQLDLRPVYAAVSVLAAAGIVVTTLFAFIAHTERIERLDQIDCARAFIRAECPRCKGEMHIKSGAQKRCDTCSLVVGVRIDEPTCACGYPILGLTGENCPECNRLIPPEIRWKPPANAAR